MRRTLSLQRLFPLICALMLMTVVPFRAHAADLYTSSLNDLVLSGNTLLVSLSEVTLTPLNTLTTLRSIETSVANYQNQVVALYNTMASNTETFSLATESLLALQNLANLSASLASQFLAISQQVVTLAPLLSLTTLQSSLMAMLRLSDDIGTMADRILEMADKILIMADNIGIMADRILATQIIQSNNVALITEASLQTQQNILALFGLFLK